MVSALGQKADIRATKSHVRFTPKATLNAYFAMSALGGEAQHLLILPDWEGDDGEECTDMVHAAAASHASQERYQGRARC